MKKLVGRLVIKSIEEETTAPVDALLPKHMNFGSSYEFLISVYGKPSFEESLDMVVSDYAPIIEREMNKERD